MSETKNQVGPGRPKKNPSDKIKFSTKTIYFPASNDYDIVWNEFDLVARGNNDVSLYSRNIFNKRGTIIRRLIMQYVYEHTEKSKVKEVIERLLEEETAQRTKLYDEDNKKK